MKQWFAEGFMPGNFMSAIVTLAASVTIIVRMTQEWDSIKANQQFVEFKLWKMEQTLDRFELRINAGQDRINSIERKLDLSLQK